MTNTLPDEDTQRADQESHALWQVYSGLRQFRRDLWRRPKNSCFRNMAESVYILAHEQLQSVFHDAELNHDISIGGNVVRRVLDILAQTDNTCGEANGVIEPADRALAYASASMVAALMRLVRGGAADIPFADEEAAALRPKAEELELLVAESARRGPLVLPSSAEPYYGSLTHGIYRNLPALVGQTLDLPSGSASRTLGERLITLAISQLQSGTRDHARCERALEIFTELRACLAQQILSAQNQGADSLSDKDQHLLWIAAPVCVNLMGVMCAPVNTSPYHAAWVTVLAKCALELRDIVVTGSAEPARPPALFSCRNPRTRVVQLAEFADLASDFTVLPAADPDEAHFVLGPLLLIAIWPDGQRRDFDLMFLDDEHELPHLMRAPHIVPATDPPHIRYIDRAERSRELSYDSENLRYDSRLVALLH